MQASLAMKMSRMWALGALSLGALVLSAAGCHDPDDHSHGGTADAGEVVEGDPLAPGFSKTGEAGLTVELLELSPAETVRGDNTWMVNIKDATALQAGCSVEVEPFMPAHGHGANQPVVVSDLGDGSYELTPLNLFMRGLWTVDISVNCAGLTDVIRFEVWVEG
jgi:hypothetical protein